MKENNAIFIWASMLIVMLLNNSFSQTDWSKDDGNPILRSGDLGAWDYHLIFPFVLKEGNVWKMWYNGAGGIWQTGYATSLDGLTWIKYESNPVMNVGQPGNWDDSGVFNPQIIYDGSIYRMWYGGWDGAQNSVLSWVTANTRLGYATSTDGITWTKYENNPIMGIGDSWDVEGHYGYSLIFLDSTYHLWFGGLNGTSGHIGYAHSADGIQWERDTVNNPILSPGTSGEWDSLYVCFPTVLYNHDSARFEMWFHGGVNQSEKHVGFATSTDGILWSKYVDNPILISEPDSWEDQRYTGTYVLLMEDKYKMWYAAKGASVQIGYATAPITTLDEIDFGEYPKRFDLRQNYPNPFNPSTKLEFTLPKSEFVELKVYNILGIKVSTLVSKKINQGNHTYTFDGKNLASGVYYYRLVAGDYREIKKMILLK